MSASLCSHYERYGFYTYFDSMAVQILKQLEKFNESPTGEHVAGSNR